MYVYVYLYTAKALLLVPYLGSGENLKNKLTSLMWMILY